MQIRLVYQKVLGTEVQRIEIPINALEEIPLKADAIANVCEEKGVTHNFHCIRFDEANWRWVPWDIPKDIADKML